MTDPASAPPADRPAKTVLVLSGGGANGAVEVGFYQALREYGITLDLILGTSIGAINGAMIASGLPPEEIQDRWRRTTRRELLQWNWWELLTRGTGARSLFSGRQFRRFLERAIPARTFSELMIPFIAVASDMRTAEVITLEEGDLIDAVQASSAIPGFYPPVTINGRQLVDGGILRQIPVDVAIDRGATTTIVALAECRNEPHQMPRGFIDAWGRSFSIAVKGAAMYPGFFDRVATRTRLVLLEPCFMVHVNTRNVFDLSQTDTLVRLGYEYAVARLEQEGFAPPD
ncbi:MAG: patatin-like phospholipase family protein [Candidatus Coatesbacteria bacterium]